MKKTAITSTIVAIVILISACLFQADQMTLKGYSKPTSDEKQMKSFQQPFIWTTNQESSDPPKAGGNFRKVSGKATTGSSDLGSNAGIGKPAVWLDQIPKKWLEQQSDYVRNAVSKKQFVKSKEGVLGVIDASGRFVTWPGAPRNTVRF